MNEGVLDFILVNSQKGGVARVTSPLSLADFKGYQNGRQVQATFSDNVFTFNTEAGREYLIAKRADVVTVYACLFKQ